MDDKVQGRIKDLSPYLNEKQYRLLLASEARSYGWGGQSKISKLSGASRSLISRGINELENPELQTEKERIRHSGAGRKKEVVKQEGLVSAILQIVEPHTVGDPMKPLLWTGKSVRHIQEELKTKGVKVSKLHPIRRSFFCAKIKFMCRIWGEWFRF